MSERGLYKVQTVARLLGMSPALLRTWESRFGLLEPERTERGHRLYTRHDLVVLRAIKKLMAEGLNIGEIALLGRRHLLSEAAPEMVADNEVGADALGGFWERTLALALEGATEELLAEVDQALQIWSPEFFVGEVVAQLPARLRSLPSEQTALAKGMERLLALRIGNMFLGASPLDPHAPRAICCGFPGDQEELPALIAAYLLARHGWRVAYLGTACSFHEIEQATHQLRPELILLSVTRPLLYLVHGAAVASLSFCLSDPAQLWVAGEGVERSQESSYVELPGALSLEKIRAQLRRTARQTV